MKPPRFNEPEFNPQRRALLTGQRVTGQHITGQRNEAERPPWTDSSRLAAACTQCGACIAACPESILLIDHAGFPMLDFSRGGCSFCAACVDACHAPVFRPREEVPWHKLAVMDQHCLAIQGVVCQSCKDACDAGAIRFTRQLGQVPRPEITAEDCTGCGACLAPCPGDAITIRAIAPLPAMDSSHVGT